MSGAKLSKTQYFLGGGLVLCLVLLLIVSSLTILRIFQVAEQKELQTEISQLREMIEQKAQAEVEMDLLNDLLKENERGLMNLRRNLRNLWEYEDVETPNEGNLPEVNTPIQSYKQPSASQGNVYYIDGSTEPELIVDDFVKGEVSNKDFQNEVKTLINSPTQFISNGLNQTSRDFRNIQTVSATSQSLSRGLGTTRQRIQKREARSFTNTSRGFGRGLGTTRNRTLTRNTSRSFSSVPINQASQDFRDTPRFNEVQYAEKVDYIPVEETSFSSAAGSQISR